MRDIKKPEPTQTQLRKKKEQEKYNLDPQKDFITEKNREEFGHICYNCTLKLKCRKWYGAIIIICDRFEEKQFSNNRAYKKHKQ